MISDFAGDMKRFGESAKRFADALADMVTAACRVLRNGTVKVAKDAERMLVNVKATPNERRMMHNKRLRIREKYYNRDHVNMIV